MLIHTLINDLGFIKITEEEKAKRGSQFDKEFGPKEYVDLSWIKKNKYIRVLIITMRWLYIRKRVT